MPGVATWWCGEEAALDYVAGHLAKLVIKPVFRPLACSRYLRRQVEPGGQEPR